MANWRVAAILVGVLLAALLLPTSIRPSSTPASAAETVTLNPTADTYVRVDRPTKAFGSGTKLLVDGSPETISYLRFTVPLSGNDQIQSATLRLRATASTANGGIVAPVTNDTWQESSLTWNNAPGADAGPTAAIGPVSQGQWTSVDVTDVIAGDAVPSMRIRSTSATGTAYISRNGAASLRPQLIVVIAPPADTQPPDVTITQPSEGDEVSGGVAVRVDATDDVGVTRVEVTVDDVPVGSDDSVPYEVHFNSAGVANGQHVIKATAYDVAGNAGSARPVSVTVSNAPDDEPPGTPTNLVATPVSAHRIDLSWTAPTDNVGVDRYRILRDGVAVGTASSAVFTDQGLAPTTRYQYVVVAIDGAGNSSEASAPASATTLEVSPAFVFAASGDHGDNDTTSASLAVLNTSDAEFYLALGDMDYNKVDDDSAWCQFVSNRLPAKGAQFPFQLVSGNHEQDGASDSNILNLASCLPDRMDSTIAPGSVYGAEYFFDYPADKPLMRVVMLPANLTVAGMKYLYAAGSPHRDWLISVIDQARADGIPWITVGTHYQCLTASLRLGCTMTKPLWNLLLDKRVDLILTGHEHSYQRSKQLATNPVSCPSMEANAFNPACIVDHGADNEYVKGLGSVNVIAGVFGESLKAPVASDPEAPYFAVLDGTTYGYMEYRVTPDRIDARFLPSTGTSTDAFSIVAG